MGHPIPIWEKSRKAFQKRLTPKLSLKGQVGVRPIKIYKMPRPREEDIQRHWNMKHGASGELQTQYNVHFISTIERMHKVKGEANNEWQSRGSQGKITEQTNLYTILGNLDLISKII